MDENWRETLIFIDIYGKVKRNAFILLKRILTPGLG